MMTNSFKEHDVVVLKVDMNDIAKGTIGTIIFDYESGGMFEVEFFDYDHNTIRSIRVFKGDLEKTNRDGVCGAESEGLVQN